MTYMIRLLLAAVAGSLASVAAAADFIGGGTGPIPDGSPAGMTITFNVSGMAQPIDRVNLRLGLTHTWAGDLKATLVSPGGKAQLVVFGRVGVSRSSTYGTPANFNGTYDFGDTGADLWATTVGQPSTFDIPAGPYRTSTEGTKLGLSGGCGTSLALAFGGLSGSDVNGAWTLTISDNFGGDTGSVNSARLSLLDDAIFGDGFDATRGHCRRAWADYTGSGRTSYTVVRNTGGGANGDVTWFVKGNDGTAAGPVQSFVFGTATNFFTSGDFDGDGIADAVVWVPGAAGAAAFKVRRSSRPTDVPLIQVMGQTGDNPTHIGDYDGDGIDDFALYRAGSAPGDASHTLIRLSSTGALRDLVTGENGAFAMGGVDYTGDGRADMAIQSNAGGGVAQFRIYDGTTGAIARTFNFGTPSNVVVVGNHVGNELHDITTTASSGGVVQWTSYDMGTSTGQPSVAFGASATDYVLSGDYDGDGLDDYAVWRPSATAGESKFMVRGSVSTVADMPWGQNGDYPIANVRAH